MPEVPRETGDAFEPFDRMVDDLERHIREYRRAQAEANGSPISGVPGAVLCPTCSGNGGDPAREYMPDCPTCGGKGQLDVSAVSPPPEVDGWTSFDVPDPKGGPGARYWVQREPDVSAVSGDTLASTEAYWQTLLDRANAEIDRLRGLCQRALPFIEAVGPKPPALLADLREVLGDE